MGVNNKPRRYTVWIRWISILLIVVAAFWVLTILADPLIDPLKQWIAGFGGWAKVVFGAVYVVATVVFFPASLLTLAAGALFGVWNGFVVVSLGSTIGAGCAFLIARYLARARIEKRARGNDKFAAIDRAIDEGGWKIVAMLRLSPAIPFNLQNYFYGLTPIRFGPYLLTSWIAMMPGTMLYVYLGYVAGQAVGAGQGASIGKWALLIVGLLATLGVTVYITKVAQRTLRAQTQMRETNSVETQPTSEVATTSAPAASGRFGVAFTVVIALLTVAGAAYAQLNRAEVQDAVGRWVMSITGPPAVTLAETYAGSSQSAAFDHGLFDQLLKVHVDDAGWVDYRGFLRDQDILDQYISALWNADFDGLSRDGKLALLINAYNAFTIRLILDHWEDGALQSIEDIATSERWGAVRWTIGPKTLSLNQIEHEEIRLNFIEPRIHFALVCAAVGCPPLRNEAYVGDRIEEQLEDQARYIHAHKTWFDFDGKGNTVRLTSLYKWYRDDFEQVAGSVLNFAARYAEPLRQGLQRGGRPSRTWIDYDWALNDVGYREPR